MKSKNGIDIKAINSQAARYIVEQPEDTVFIRKNVRQTAKDIGFDLVSIEEISVITTELLNNFVKHSCLEPELWVTVLQSTGEVGLEICAVDKGPGIRNLTRALEDYVSSDRGMGCGLGAVQRLAHEFDIFSLAEGNYFVDRDGVEPKGTAITVRKWLNKQTIPQKLHFSGYSRPHCCETAVGDTFLFEKQGDNLLVAVLDGLGHGPEACKASQLGGNIILAHCNEPLDKILKYVHEGIAYTRGTVLAMMRIDPNDGFFDFLGVGNIQTKILPKPREIPFSKGGIVGCGRLEGTRVTRSEWHKGAILVMTSDGVRECKYQELSNSIFKHEPSTICQFMMKNYSRQNDDAAICIVKDMQLKNR